MNEEKLDRRAQWVKWVGVMLVAGTVYILTIKLTLNQLDTDFRDYKKEMKLTLKEMDNRMDNISDRLIQTEDTLWPKNENRGEHVHSARP